MGLPNPLYNLLMAYVCFVEASVSVLVSSRLRISPQFKTSLVLHKQFSLEMIRYSSVRAALPGSARIRL